MIFNREEQHLMLEGSVLSKEDVKRLVACHTEEASGFLYELYRFMEEWFSLSDSENFRFYRDSQTAEGP